VSAIKETKFFVTSDTFRPINTEDLLKYIPTNKNIIWLKHHDMVIDMYQYAVQQWDWASTDQYNDARMILSKSSSNKKNKMSWS